jgi:type IV secretory pathway component VirB8
MNCKHRKSLMTKSLNTNRQWIALVSLYGMNANRIAVIFMLPLSSTKPIVIGVVAPAVSHKRKQPLSGPWKSSTAYINSDHPVVCNGTVFNPV